MLLAMTAVSCGSSNGWSAYGENAPDENEYGEKEEKIVVQVTVTYLERIAVPPNSTVRAAIYDESHDLKPAISSNAVTTREGRGVPVELVISYPVDQIDDSHEYVVRGEITDPGGVLLFTTEEPIRIDPDEKEPQKVELVLKRVVASQQD